MTVALQHKPIMTEEVLAALDVQRGGVYVDGTFGRGGHTRAILAANANTHVIAIDRDPCAEAAAAALALEFPGRLIFVFGRFSALAHHVRTAGYSQVDGVFLDIGVSSPQLDEAARGFSFMQNGPLDMRMGATGMSAAEVVNSLGEEALADVIYTLGEERRSRAIAAAIVRERAIAPIEDTARLANIIRKVVRRDVSGKDPATRTFQALRMYVNEELPELEAALKGAEEILSPGGRLVVLTFHSLEDRILKDFIKHHSQQAAQGSRYEMPQAKPTQTLTFSWPHRKAQTPNTQEIAHNPRARSAKLRWAIRQGGLYA